MKQKPKTPKKTNLKKKTNYIKQKTKKKKTTPFPNWGGFLGGFGCYLFFRKNCLKTKILQQLVKKKKQKKILQKGFLGKKIGFKKEPIANSHFFSLRGGGVGRAHF